MNIETTRPQHGATRRTPMEHRWGMRVPADFPVTLECRNQVIGSGRLANASISGALLLTDTDIPALMPLTVIIHAIVGQRADTVRLAACVVRTEAGATAVEWRDMATEPLVALLHEVQRDAQLWARDGTFS